MLPALLASLLLTSASPEDSRQAAALFHRSMTEYELGNFDAALDAAAKAYRLDPKPGLLFNLGQCHRALHHWEQAAFFYGEYLHKVPAAANRSVVEELIVEMKLELKDEKAAAAREPKQPVLVEAPLPAPVPPGPMAEPPSEPPPAPTWAVTEAPAAGTHSHWLGATLATAAAICAGFAIYGAVRAINYQQFPTQTTSWTQYDQALAANYQNSGNWGTAAIALGVAAAGGVTGAIFTW